MPVTIRLTYKLIIPDNDILNISWRYQIVISTISLPKLQVDDIQMRKKRHLVVIVYCRRENYFLVV